MLTWKRPKNHKVRRIRLFSFQKTKNKKNRFSEQFRRWYQNPSTQWGGVPTDCDPSLWEIRAQLRLASHIYIYISVTFLKDQVTGCQNPWCHLVIEFLYTVFRKMWEHFATYKWSIFFFLVPGTLESSCGIQGDRIRRYHSSWPPPSCPRSMKQRGGQPGILRGPKKPSKNFRLRR